MVFVLPIKPIKKSRKCHTMASHAIIFLRHKSQSLHFHLSSKYIQRTKHGLHKGSSLESAS